MCTCNLFLIAWISFPFPIPPYHAPPPFSSPFSFHLVSGMAIWGRCPVWYVRNSAEQPRRGRRGKERRGKEEDEGRLLFQISCPKPQKTQSERKGKFGWEGKTLWETLKRYGNDCSMEKNSIWDKQTDDQICDTSQCEALNKIECKQCSEMAFYKAWRALRLYMGHLS